MRSLSRACLSVRQAESREGLQPAQKAFRKREAFFVFKFTSLSYKTFHSGCSCQIFFWNIVL